MDEIVLTIPRERPFYGVAHLVLGGIASRLNLTLESLDDLKLGLDSLLAQDDGETEVTLRVRVGDAKIQAEIGPFNESLRVELERESGAGVGLRRVLDTVVDRLEVEDVAGATWVRLTKAVDARPE